MKKILLLTLIMMISLTLVSCDKKEDAKSKEETVTFTDDEGNEFEYSKSVAEQIGIAFDILDKFTWQELELFDEKDRYLWGPETQMVAINYNGEMIKTIVIYASIETVNGLYDVGTYYVDCNEKRVYIWDDTKQNFKVLEVEE